MTPAQYPGNPATDVERWVGTVPANVLAAPIDYATNTHAAATITLPAPPAGYANVLSGVAYSYSGGSPSGTLSITDGTSTVFGMDIVGQLAGQINFTPPKQFAQTAAPAISLSDGGANVVGKVSLLGHYLVQDAPLYTHLTGFGQLDFSDRLNSQFVPLIAL